MTDQTVVPKFDTVAIAVPIDGFNEVGTTHTVDGYGTESERHRWSRKLPGGGFLATGVGNAAWIEASLPKRIDEEGMNIAAVELDPAIDALYALYGEARDYLEVDPAHCFEESKVVRLDMVRDFTEVDDLGIILDGLARVDQPGRSKVRRFADPGRGQAETLRVGPKAWGCTLYDKHAETNGKAPAGSLRFEARLHHDQLTSVFARKHGGHVAVIGDLIGGNLDGSDRVSALGRAQRAWFDRAGFDRTVAPRDAVGQLVRACTDMTAATRGTLWAYLTLPGFANDMHRHTRRKYRNLAHGLGIAPAWFHADDTVRAVPASVGLDYDRGTVLAA